jgi:hypothetical protein
MLIMSLDTLALLACRGQRDLLRSKRDLLNMLALPASSVATNLCDKLKNDDEKFENLQM